MDKLLCESKAWISGGMVKANIKVYKDRIEVYRGSKLVKEYFINDIKIISSNSNGTSTLVLFTYKGKKEKIWIKDDKINEVFNIINKDTKNKKDDVIKEDSIITNEDKRDNNDNTSNNNAGGVISLIVSIIFILVVGYKLNWFSSIGINSTGINGCYYNESEKDSLCINGKEATFKSVKDTKYYVKYNSDSIKIEDKYGNTIIFECKRVKDSKDIICDELVLHKK